jgi:nucleoside-diphosphate-sugar epimerase
MSRDNILVTGATGLLGGALSLELLPRTDGRIYCLTRGADQTTATRRLHSALRAAAHAYDATDLLDDIAGRCVAVPGDITDINWTDECDVPANVFIHAAASLKYAERDEAEVTQVNVEGTRMALRLAERLRVDKFCHVSTAYVAGERTGLIAEDDPAPPDTQLNNSYERSKVMAERLLRESAIPSIVVRPSIIIGHSRTHQATSFSGMYGLLDEVNKFKRRVSRKMGNYLQYNPIRLLAEPDMPLNLLPIDATARAIAGLAMRGWPEAAYHVTNNTPPVLSDCIGVGFNLLGLPSPEYVSSDGQLTDLDRKLHTEFYEAYMKNAKKFSTKNTLSVLGDGALDVEVSSAGIEAQLRWYRESGYRKGERLAVG